MDVVSPSFLSGEGVIDTSKDTSNTAICVTLKNLNTVKRMKHSVCLTAAE